MFHVKHFTSGVDEYKKGLMTTLFFAFMTGWMDVALLFVRSILPACKCQTAVRTAKAKAVADGIVEVFYLACGVGNVV